VDGRKNARLLVAARPGDGDADVFKVLSLLLQEHDYVDAGASAYGRKQYLHGAHARVVPTSGGAGVGFDGPAVFVGGLKVEGVV